MGDYLRAVRFKNFREKSRIIDFSRGLSRPCARFGLDETLSVKNNPHRKERYVPQMSTAPSKKHEKTAIFTKFRPESPVLKSMALIDNTNRDTVGYFRANFEHLPLPLLKDGSMNTKCPLIHVSLGLLSRRLSFVYFGYSVLGILRDRSPWPCLFVGRLHCL